MLDDRPQARDALEAMERMASTGGFNYGRLTRKGVLWYLPTPRKLGFFYLDDGHWFRVGRRAMGEALTIGARNERGYTIVTPPGD